METICHKSAHSTRSTRSSQATATTDTTGSVLKPYGGSMAGCMTFYSALVCSCQARKRTTHGSHRTHNVSIRFVLLWTTVQSSVTVCTTLSDRLTVMPNGSLKPLPTVLSYGATLTGHSRNPLFYRYRRRHNKTDIFCP